MAKKTVQTLESLLKRGLWEKARHQVEHELKLQPDDHWLLTQLGVTDCEQGRYRESIPHFLAAL